MVTPYPGERTDTPYHFPEVGTFVRLRGLVSTTYLRRGETIVVRWTQSWEEHAIRNYIDIVSMIEEPSASEYFPTMDEVWNLIEVGAQTLPGEKILGLRATNSQIIARVGVDVGASREFAVSWPELESILREVMRMRDHTGELAGDAVDALEAGVEQLKGQLVSYNGIAVAAAQVALDAAEEAKEWSSESGRSAYEIAVQRGYVGTEEQWLSSLQGEAGPAGPRGEQGPRGPQGETGARGPEGPDGPRGEQGPAGEDGRSVAISGTVATPADLPTDLGVDDSGRGWVSQDTGHLNVWGGDAWTDVGPVRGPRGPQGQRGEKGEQGEEGPRGEQGQIGPAGMDGEDGAPGPKGEPGPRGEKGDQGMTGQPGATGPRGEKGEAGDDGVPFLLQGTVSSTSDLPTNPTTGHAYALPDGTAVQWLGTHWSEPVMLRGPQGAKGDTGEQGPRGYQGPVGNTGPRGVQGTPGADGELTSGQKAAIFGSSQFSTKPYGSLLWSGPAYSPPTGFTRLRSISDGRLVVGQNREGVASTSLNNPRLTAPVDGVYLLYVAQPFTNGAVSKGAGLGSDINSGTNQMHLWADLFEGGFVSGSAVRYLTAGTTLYPWIFAQPAAGMTGMDRGFVAEYSLTFLTP